MSSIPLAPVLGPWLGTEAPRERAVGRGLQAARPVFPTLPSDCPAAPGNASPSQAQFEGGLLSPDGSLRSPTPAPAPTE